MGTRQPTFVTKGHNPLHRPGHTLFQQLVQLHQPTQAQAPAQPRLRQLTLTHRLFQCPPRHQAEAQASLAALGKRASLLLRQLWGLWSWWPWLPCWESCMFVAIGVAPNMPCFKTTMRTIRTKRHNHTYAECLDLPSSHSPLADSPSETGSDEQ